MPANRAYLEFLSEDELAQIEETAFRLLDEVGISVQHAEATEMLAERGSRVGRGRVFVPRHVVEWALKNVTAHTQWHMADGRWRMADGSLAIGRWLYAIGHSLSASRHPTVWRAGCAARAHGAGRHRHPAAQHPQADQLRWGGQGGAGALRG